MQMGQGAPTAGLEWAHAVVRWAEVRGISLKDSTELFPYVDVVLWARALRAAPDPRTIIARWGVNRATAYRWAPVLADVHARRRPVRRQCPRRERSRRQFMANTRCPV
jgi:hypothetical protein